MHLCHRVGRDCRCSVLELILCPSLIVPHAGVQGQLCLALTAPRSLSLLPPLTVRGTSLWSVSRGRILPTSSPVAVRPLSKLTFQIPHFLVLDVPSAPFSSPVPLLRTASSPALHPAEPRVVTATLSSQSRSPRRLPGPWMSGQCPVSPLGMSPGPGEGRHAGQGLGGVLGRMSVFSLSQAMAPGEGRPPAGRGGSSLNPPLPA